MEDDNDPGDHEAGRYSQLGFEAGRHAQLGFAAWALRDFIAVILSVDGPVTRGTPRASTAARQDALTTDKRLMA